MVYLNAHKCVWIITVFAYEQDNLPWKHFSWLSYWESTQQHFD